jgi:hypothetical protein
MHDKQPISDMQTGKNDSCAIEQLKCDEIVDKRARCSVFTVSILFNKSKKELLIDLAAFGV